MYSKVIMSALTCLLCHSPFNSEAHQSFSLSCGHCICLACGSSQSYPIQCPLDSRFTTAESSMTPSIYTNAIAVHSAINATDSLSAVKSEYDSRLASLHLTFDSLESQLEARKFVLRAEASNIASKDIQQREALLEMCLRLQQDDESTGSPQLKHLMEKVSALRRDKFRLSCIFDKVNANRFIATIGTEQPDLVRTRPFECDAFTNVTYWMLPPCCHRSYCCVKCHNAKEDHVWQYANRMICIFCGREQEYRKLPNQCLYCKHEHSGVRNK